MRRHHEELVARGVEVVILGPDKPGRFRAYWQRHNLPFVGLPDPEHKVLRRYGQEVRILKLGRMPATVLVDVAGIVRLAHYGRSMGDVTSTRDVLSVVDELGSVG